REAARDLVDDADANLAADHTVGAMTATQRLQRVTHLHGTICSAMKGRVGVRTSKLPESGKMRFFPPAAKPRGTGRFLSHGGYECQPKRAGFGPRGTREWPLFRDDAKHRTRNLEIPGLVLRTIPE